jgi:hypothetical protein
VAALVVELQRDLHALRTICYGFSAGAYFSSLLTVTHPELVDAAIPHSGGVSTELEMMPSRSDKLKERLFYLIHGDKDSIVDVEESRRAVKRLKAWGVAVVEYEELKGMDHTMSKEASKRGFDWVEKHLGPVLTVLADNEVGARLKALDKAIKAKDPDATIKAFEALKSIPKRFRGAVAGQCKAQLASADEKVALAAIECAGGLGDEGALALKTVSPANEKLAPAAADALARTFSAAAPDVLLGYLKGKSEDVAVAAAKALQVIAGEPALVALTQGLAFAESTKEAEKRDDRDEAIRGALKKLTGERFEHAADAKRWLEEHAQK